MRWTAPSGSSPLARGLPEAARDLPLGGRIIPARAGFTRRRAGRPGRPRDHPRSRGVYGRLTTAQARAAGSSPLARGLRRYCGRVVLCYRIIPARAGFTTLSRRIPGSCSDHPRSRGVYFSCAWGMILPARIIPARAGFTNPRRSRRPRDRDHPRSRGVYIIAVIHVADVLRIIPARAGFTGPI